MVLSIYTVSPVDDRSTKYAHRPVHQRAQPGEPPACDILTDVVEKKHCYEFRSELPGVPKEQVELEIDNDILTFGVKYKDDAAKHEAPAVKRHRIERPRHYRRRQFKLPDDADLSKVDAKCEAGVLTIVVPKKEHASAGRRRIPIA